jgi:hypothetical protein
LLFTDACQRTKSPWASKTEKPVSPESYSEKPRIPDEFKDTAAQATSLYNEKKFSKWDIVHYIPFILFLINYLPFYLIPINEKAEIVNAVVLDQSLIYKNNAGVLPEYILFILRFFQTIIYLVFNWGLIKKYKKNNISKQVQHQITSVIKWLKFFNWTGVVNLGGSILLILLMLVFNGSFIVASLNLIPGLIIALSFFAIS